MPKNTFHPTVFMTVALLVFALLVVPQVFAVTFEVNSIDDLPDDLTKPGICHTAINTCTLRAAVMQANRTSGVGAIIIVPSGIYTLTIPAAGADGEENGDLNLTSPTIGSPVITVIGAGASTTIIDANQLDRVFHIGADRRASITGVTIRNGYTFYDGGGIFNSGVLTVTNSTISGNQALGNIRGGGIFNSGYLTVTNSTISGNYSMTSGGGIFNVSTLTVTNSTISGNYADYYDGGGIFNNGNLTVTNSTISGNQAMGRGGFGKGGGILTGVEAWLTDTTISGNYSRESGGGIYSSGTLTVTNSTISKNLSFDGGGILNAGILIVTNTTISQNDASTNGGGIYNNINGNANVYNTSIVFNDADADADPIYGGSGGGVYNSPGATFNLRNTLVAGNTVTNPPIDNDCTGTLNSYGRNLFGDLTNCTVDTVSGSWDYFNGDLGPLQNNGGPTWTHALLPGSNAIDGGDQARGCIGPDAFPLATDQRGGARVVGNGCDIGAFEYGAKVPWLYLPFIIRN